MAVIFWQVVMVKQMHTVLSFILPPPGVALQVREDGGRPADALALHPLRGHAGQPRRAPPDGAPLLQPPEAQQQRRRRRHELGRFRIQRGRAAPVVLATPAAEQGGDSTKLQLNMSKKATYMP